MLADWFILTNSQEDESCSKMMMSDVPLFTQYHYDIVKNLIEENKTITEIDTIIFLRHSSIDKTKIPKKYFSEEKSFINIIFKYEATVTIKINSDLSPDLSTQDVFEKIYELLKPFLLFH